ncbi:PFI1-like helicase [Mollivirus sibericum]|uniref:helicase n=1 Tax=Mollivirus sibericum TaxID=1678078 RepID=UPI0006B2DB18|nr:helicase [Mollivirus sibericum]ALD62187.1 PFI1-like helicase [Mollivirus sibericum]
MDNPAPQESRSRKRMVPLATRPCDEEAGAEKEEEQPEKEEEQGNEDEGLRRSKRQRREPMEDWALAKFRETYKDVKLSDGQKEALEVAKRGDNLSVSGSGGTGKSLAAKMLIGTLMLEKRKTVRVVASTGGAAQLIGGDTAHSALGDGINPDDPVKSAVRLLSKNKGKKADYWCDTEVLFFDEVGMIEPVFFEWMAMTVGHIRARRKVKGSFFTGADGKRVVRPFGGIQVIVFGDFLQLQPIVKGIPRGYIPTVTDGLLEFPFQLDVWRELDFHCIELTHVFRQSDRPFVAALNDIRFGRVTPHAARMFESCVGRRFEDAEDDESKRPTRIYTKRDKVNEYNKMMMEKLPKPEKRYRGTIQYDYEPGALADYETKSRFGRHAFNLKKHCRVPEELALRKGALVMLTRNLRYGGLTNGSVGVVVGFVVSVAPPAKPDGAETKGEALDVPSAAPYDPDAGVGFSGDTTKTEEEAIIEDDEEAVVYDESWSKDDESFEWLPRVRWNNGMVTTVTIQSWSTKEPGCGGVYYWHLPLIPAWASTAHAAQGQTLERVIIDTNNTFACGQLYIALSRATSLEGISLLNWDPTAARAHPKAIEYYRNGMRWDYPVSSATATDPSTLLGGGDHHHNPPIGNRPVSRLYQPGVAPGPATRAGSSAPARGRGRGRSGTNTSAPPPPAQMVIINSRKSNRSNIDALRREIMPSLGATGAVRNNYCAPEVQAKAAANSKREYDNKSGRGRGGRN